MKLYNLLNNAVVMPLEVVEYLEQAEENDKHSFDKKYK